MGTVKVDNETELTSTVGNVLSTSIKDEKSDTGDATPTSSTDASTITISSQIVSDDPISSTSSDVIEQMKPKTSASAMKKPSDEDGKVSSMDQEADLLEMSMTDVTVSNEKITEDVEDLVHDLESLLGESTELYNVPGKQQKDGSATPPETLSSDALAENENEKGPVSPKSEAIVKGSTENDNVQDAEKLTDIKVHTVTEESSNTLQTCLESKKVGDGVEYSDICQESSKSKDKDTDNNELAHIKPDTAVQDPAVILDKEKCDGEPVETNADKLTDGKVDILVEETSPKECVDNKEICDLKSEEAETDTMNEESSNICQNVMDRSNMITEDTDHDKLSLDKIDNVVDKSSNAHQSCTENRVKSDIEVEDTDTNDKSNANNENVVQEYLGNKETSVGEETSNTLDEILEKNITTGDPVDNTVSDVQPDTSSTQKESSEINDNNTSSSRSQEISENEENNEVHQKDEVLIGNVDETQSNDIDTEKVPQMYNENVKESCSDTKSLDSETTLNNPEESILTSIEANCDKTDSCKDETPLENSEIKMDQPEEPAAKQVEEFPDVPAAEDITENDREVIESENVDMPVTADDNTSNKLGSADSRSKIINKEDQQEVEPVQAEAKTGVETVEDNFERDTVNNCELKEQDNTEVEIQQNNFVEESVEDETDQNKFEEERVEDNAEVESVKVKEHLNSEVEIDDNTNLKEQHNCVEENVEDETNQNNCEEATVEDNSEVELVQDNPEVKDQHNEEVEMQHDTDLTEPNVPGVNTVEDNNEVEVNPEEENVEDDPKVQTAEENPEDDVDLKEQDNIKIAAVEDNSEVKVIHEEKHVEDDPEVQTAEENTGDKDLYSPNIEVQDDVHLKEQNNLEIAAVEDNPEVEVIHEEKDVEDDPEVQTTEENPGDKDLYSSNIEVQGDVDLKEQNNPEIAAVEDNHEVEVIHEEENVEDDPKVQTAEENTEDKDLVSSNIEIQDDVVLKEQDNLNMSAVEDNPEVEVIHEEKDVEDDPEVQTAEENPGDKDLYSSNIEGQGDVYLKEQNNLEIADVEDNPEVENFHEEKNVEDDPEVQTAEENPGDKDLYSSNIEIQDDVDLKEQDNLNMSAVEDNPEVEVIHEEKNVEDDPEDLASSNIEIQDDVDLKHEDNLEIAAVEDNPEVEAIDENPENELVQDISEVLEDNSITEIIQDNSEDGNVEAIDEIEAVESDSAVEAIRINSQDECKDSSEVQIQHNKMLENPELESAETGTDETQAESGTVTDVDKQEVNVPESSELEDIPNIEASAELARVVDIRMSESENGKMEDILPKYEVEDENISPDIKNIEEDTPTELETIPKLNDKDMIETEESETAPTEEEVGVQEDLNSSNEETNEVSGVVPELDDDKTSAVNETLTGTESAISFEQIVDSNTSKLDDITAITKVTEEICSPHELSPKDETSQNVSEELPATDECTESTENQADTTEVITNINDSENCVEVENQSDLPIYEDTVEEHLIENVQSTSCEDIESCDINNDTQSDITAGETVSTVPESNIVSETSPGDGESAVCNKVVKTEGTEMKVCDEIANEGISTPKSDREQLPENSTEGISEIGDAPISEEALKCGVIAEELEDDNTDALEFADTDKNEIIEETNRLSVATNENRDIENMIDEVNLSQCLDKVDNNEGVKANVADSIVESTVIVAGDESDEEVVPVLALEPEEEGHARENKSESVLNSKTEDAVGEIAKPEVPKESPIEPSNDKKSSKTIKDSLKKNQKISTIKKKSGNSKTVKPVIENIPAVDNLEKIEALEPTPNVDSTLSDKEKMEMEALRKAVESITDVSENVYEDEIDKEINIPKETVSKSREIIESDEKNHVLSNDCDKTHEIVQSSIEICENSESNMSGGTAKYNDDREIENDKLFLGTSPDSSQTIPESDSLDTTVTPKEKEPKTKTTDKPKRHRKTISENKLEELSINVDVSEKDKTYSPKITIKPIKVPDEEVSTTSNSDSDVVKGSLKMTITKQSDKMHSILKICDPENSETAQETEEHVPKLKIKPIVQPVEQHSPKMATRSSKHLYSPTSSTQRSSSPRVTIKPVLKPEKQEPVNPLKIKIGVLKSDEKPTSKHSNKPVKSDEEVPKETILSPKKVVIKPILKPAEETEQVHSPRITIKPMSKKETEKEPSTVTKLNIKLKKNDDVDIELEKERSSPKITIKPIVKPQEPEVQTVEGDDEGKGRIVLKINKGNLPTSTKESKKREHPVDDDKLEKVKITKGNNFPSSSKDSKKREHSLDDDKSEKTKIIRASPTSTKDSKKREHLVGDDKTEKLKIIKASLSTPTKDCKKWEHSAEDDKSEKVKTSKVNIPTSTKETKKREHLTDDDKSEKLAKITVKFSKGGGHPHIVQQTEETLKRTHEEPSPEKHKKQKVEPESSIATRTRHKEVTVEVSSEKSNQKEASSEAFSDDTKHKDLSVELLPEKSKEIDSSETSKLKLNDSEVSSSELRVKHKDPIAETPIEAKRPKKDKDAEGSSPSRNSGKIEDDVKIINSKLDSPIVISEDSRSQDSGSCIIIDEPKDTPVVESQPPMTPDTASSSPAKVDSTTGTPTSTPIPIAPRKRGRPRKVPLQVREEFKDSEDPTTQKKDQPTVHESGRPKRSCRGQSARDTLGIKPRKPRTPGRGRGRGRGSKRGMGNRSELERLSE